MSLYYQFVLNVEKGNTLPKYGYASRDLHTTTGYAIFAVSLDPDSIHVAAFRGPFQIPKQSGQMKNPKDGDHVFSNSLGSGSHPLENRNLVVYLAGQLIVGMRCIPLTHSSSLVFIFNSHSVKQG